MSTNLDYSKLKKEIIGIYEFSKKDLEKGSNRVTIESNFEIGKIIESTYGRNSEKFEYGKKIVERLAVDLNRIYGKGFSVRNLHYARKFFLFYKRS